MPSSIPPWRGCSRSRRPISRRRTGPLRRQRGAQVKKSFLLFVEGRKTEEIYLNHWARLVREHVTVKFDDFRGGPASLVDRAVKEKHRAERRQHREGMPWDQIWCVFDRDEHPGFDEACQRAIDNGIEIAVSNPCIELWFLLHREPQTAHISRTDAQRRSQATWGFGKAPNHNDLKQLVDAYATAKERAQSLDRIHAGNGSPDRENPSSSLWSLVDALRDAGGGAGL